MYKKLFNNPAATFISFSGYPLLMYIFCILKYYFAGNGGGDIIVFVSLAFALPYCIMVFFIALIVFISSRLKSKNYTDTHSLNEKNVHKKFFFLFGLFLYIFVCLIFLAVAFLTVLQEL